MASRVVAGDRYELAIRLPDGYRVQPVKPMAVTAEKDLIRTSWPPDATGEITWSLSFQAGLGAPPDDWRKNLPEPVVG